jgi:hypothetical protein
MASPAVRYSTANVSKSETAKSFAWENPVPVNKFWDGLKYCVARTFLGSFTDEEIAQLPIDPDSTASEDEKFDFLLDLLRQKLAREEADVAPQTLHKANYQRWFQIWQSISSMQYELGRPEAEDTGRMMVEKAPGNPNEVTIKNVVPIHMLASTLVKVGKYAEAEATERPVLAWMEARENLGRDSPQAMGARRILAGALWRQGPARRGEAEALIAETREIIAGMGEGKFAVYQEEEEKITEEVFANLEN